MNKNIATAIRSCPSLLFDFGVIPEMLSTQPTMIVNNRFRRSQSVLNMTCGMTTIELCLLHLWSDAMSNRKPY